MSFDELTLEQLLAAAFIYLVAWLMLALLVGVIWLCLRVMGSLDREEWRLRWQRARHQLSGMWSVRP